MVKDSGFTRGLFAEFYHSGADLQAWSFSRFEAWILGFRGLGF